MAVFVLDQYGDPLMPCSEKRARLLLERGRARVHRVVPFVIRLRNRTKADCMIQPVRLKIDPGSKFTGVAIVRENEIIEPQTGEIQKDVVVISLMQLEHRGRQISESLLARRGMRGLRRSKLRYRPARFLNRTRRKGWLPPSLQHRVDSTMSWAKRLRKWSPIIAISCERVRFDTQKMMNPEISGIEYQQGELMGYEVREYLLEKWDRKCAYCGIENVPLQIEHIHPKSKGGSNRVSNLTLACDKCNKEKDNRSIDDFLKNKPDVLSKIKSQMRVPLKDAAAVNSIRNVLSMNLIETGLPVEFSTGGRTKFNRCRFGIYKTHALDAACVGEIGGIRVPKIKTVLIKAMGRGRYQRTLLDKFGFPRSYLMKQKKVHGFATGDLVKAVVEKGENHGTYFGRVMVRKTGQFTILTKNKKFGVSFTKCRLVQRSDGYSFQ